MENSITLILLILISPKFIKRTWCELEDFNICHQDSSLNPDDGLLPDHSFPWLGFIHYKHVTTGHPHQSSAPRVILIHIQFVIGTAADIIHIPKNYKLGNVIFGDYEREEDDCDITQEEIRRGYTCPHAYLEVPLNDVLPHPEYTSFGVGNSLALIKLIVPMKSRYMIPICLPTLTERFKKKKDKSVYLIDYISSVPSEYDSENLAKRTLTLFTHQACQKYQSKQRISKESVTHMLCTTGCGVRIGAPIITRSHAGRFELMGLAVGGARCTSKHMRTRINLEPPLYIDVYPYLDWIMNVITAHKIPKSYPQNFRRGVAGIHMGTKILRRAEQKCDWNARTYMCGDHCFKSKKQRSSAAFFYMETFHVRADAGSRVKVHLTISAGIECTIVCARLQLPSRLTSPSIQGVGTYNITIKFDTDWFPYYFGFTVGLYGVNSSDSDIVAWLSDREKGN